MILLTEDEVVAEASKDKEYCQLAVDVGMWAAREQLKKVVDEIDTYRFAEPIQVPEYGREPIIICIPLEEWQALKKEAGG